MQRDSIRETGDNARVPVAARLLEYRATEKRATLASLTRIVSGYLAILADLVDGGMSVDGLAPLLSSASVIDSLSTELATLERCRRDLLGIEAHA